MLTCHSHDSDKEVDVALGQNDIFGVDFFVGVESHSAILPGGEQTNEQDDGVENDDPDEAAHVQSRVVIYVIAITVVAQASRVRLPTAHEFLSREIVFLDGRVGGIRRPARHDIGVCDRSFNEVKTTTRNLLEN